MAANKAILIVLLLGVGIAVLAQEKTRPPSPARDRGTGQTVRRHRVAEDSLARAEAAIEKKDYAAAETILRQALQQGANDYRTWFDLGFVYTATGKQPEAIDAYRKSVAANPKVFESNLNLGLTLAQTKDSDAEKYLRAATQLRPTAEPDKALARAWISLGHVLQARDPKAAVQAFEHAAQLQPSDAEPHISAAIAAEQAGDVATAEREYATTAQLDPKSSEALAGLVNVYTKSERLDEAEAALRKYLTLNPNNRAAHVQLGRVLAALHRRPEALQEFEEGLKLAPDDPVAQRQVAELYLQDKQYDKAEAGFRQIVARNPNDAEVHHGLGLSLLEQKKYKDAQQELLVALRLKPDLGQAYGDLALAASENKDYALTIKALDARAKFLPEMPATWFLRATAYDHLRDYKQAAANYHQFLSVSNGKFPDQEWQAKHRLVAIEPKQK